MWTLLFLLRKRDQARLCVCAGSAGDLVSTSTRGFEYYQALDVAGTGRYGGMFSLLKFSVETVLKKVEGMETRDGWRTRNTGRLVSLNVGLVEDTNGLYDDWLVESADWMLHMLESPAFASRWVVPRTGCESKPRATGVLSLPTAQSGPQKLFSSAPRVTQKPPPLVTCVLGRLELKDLLAASEVCRDWFSASKHDDAWAVVLKKYPLLAQMRRRSLLSWRSLLAQQVESDAAVAAGLIRQPRDAYMLGVELYADGERLCEHLIDLSSKPPNADLFGDDKEVLALYKPTEDVTVDIDSSLSTGLSIVRKHDGMRLMLCRSITPDDYKDVASDDGQLLLVECSGLFESRQKRFDIGHRGPGSRRWQRTSYPYIACFEGTLTLKKIDKEEPAPPPGKLVDMYRLKEIKLELDTGEGYDEPVIATVDGMLQMVECSCYAPLWR